MKIAVDVLTVLALGETICPPALEALNDQGSVTLTHYPVVGPERWLGERRDSAIARARNRAKDFGTAPYAMLLDSDVVLPPEGIERLLHALVFSPHYAAVGINYQEPEPPPPGAIHIAMGAVLFARSVLEQIEFRVAPQMCECLCCCLDLRRMGYFIDYCPGLRAEHLPRY